MELQQPQQLTLEAIAELDDGRISEAIAQAMPDAGRVRRPAFRKYTLPLKWMA